MRYCETFLSGRIGLRGVWEVMGYQKYLAFIGSVWMDDALEGLVGLSEHYLIFIMNVRKGSVRDRAYRDRKPAIPMRCELRLLFPLNKIDHVHVPLSTNYKGGVLRRFEHGQVTVDVLR